MFFHLEPALDFTHTFGVVGLTSITVFHEAVVILITIWSEEKVVLIQNLV
jgi:hypothetical protein